MLIALLATAGFATTYTEAFPIVRSAPVSSTDDFYTAQRSWDVGTSATNQTIASDWSYITCAVVDGYIKATFKSRPSTWPTSFPATATCTGGGHSLVLNLSTAPEPYLDYDKQFTPSIGLTINADADTAFWRNYELPASTSYTAGSYPGKLSPQTTWSGVTCTMKYGAGGTPWLQLVVDPNASGSGFCIIPRSGQTNASIDLTINR